MPTVIQRPKRYDRQTIDAEVLAALLRTLDTQEAVVLPSDVGGTYLAYNRYRTAIAAHHPTLRFHGRTGSRGLVAWVTRKEARRGSA